MLELLIGRLNTGRCPRLLLNFTIYLDRKEWDKLGRASYWASCMWGQCSRCWICCCFQIE